MIPRTSGTILLLLLAAISISILPSTCLAEDHASTTAASTTSTPFHCPESCTCTDHIVAHHQLNHARCESIEALHDKQWPVHSLDLSGLGLQKVPATVEKLRNLTRLNLSNNHITEVARLSQRIQELNLSHNRIGSGKLAKLPAFIRKLNLAHNHITVVPSTLKKLEHLREIELTGNPINCSCETIQVRNWLQSRHVWTEDVIKCALPQLYKGRPWLQVKQSDVCTMTPAEIEEEKNIWEDSNDLMMGDQPAAGSGEGQEEEEHDALEDDYMRVDEDPRAMPYGESDAELEEGSGQPITHDDPMLHKIVMDTVEGSGHVGVRLGHDSVDSTTTHPDGDDEDEGSGVPIIPIIPVSRGNLDKGKPKDDADFDHEDDKTHHEVDEPIEQPMEEPTTPGASKGLGIFQEHDTPVEEGVVKQSAPNSDAAPTDKKILAGTGSGASLEKIEQAEAVDSDKLYILLAVILFIMIALIVIVVVKQRNARRRNNRRGQADVECAKVTELQDMNNRMIGKPTEKNGNGENAPLMGQRDKSDFAKPINGQRDCDKIGFNPYEKPESPDAEKHVPLKGPSPNEEPLQKNQQPAMESFKPSDRTESQDSINENNNNNTSDDLNNNNQFLPISNGYPHENGVAHSPTTSPAGVHKSPKDEEWEKYTPRSPDMKRYSPVYSPDTGRVKIRLSETPKPKTPLLVTRSRSNAGQMILTPNLSQRPQRPANGDVSAVEA